MTRFVPARPSPRLPAFPLALVLALGSACAAAQESGGKDEPIAPDRPDFVESSEVVGKGRVQLETGLLGERARGEQGRERTLTTPTLLRIGVHEAVELRIESEGRTVRHLRDAASGERSTIAGYADTSVGLNWHLADAQGKMPSLSVLADAGLPTGSKRLRGEGVRPMLRLVGEWELPGETQLGVMPGVAVEHEQDEGATHMACSAWRWKSASTNACVASPNWPCRRLPAAATAAPRPASASAPPGWSRTTARSTPCFRAA
ncbi:transporter [Telluria sp. B2]